LGQQETLDSFEVQNSRTYDNSMKDDFQLITFYIRMDREQMATDRQIYGILQFLGEIGGLHKSLSAGGLVFVSFL